MDRDEFLYRYSLALSLHALSLHALSPCTISNNFTDKHICTDICQIYTYINRYWPGIHEYEQIHTDMHRYEDICTNMHRYLHKYAQGAYKILNHINYNLKTIYWYVRAWWPRLRHFCGGKARSSSPTSWADSAADCLFYQLLGHDLAHRPCHSSCLTRLHLFCSVWFSKDNPFQLELHALSALLLC